MTNSISDSSRNGVKGMGRNGSVLSQKDIARVIQARVDNIMKSIEEIALKAANQTSLNAAIQSIEASLNRFTANINTAPFKSMWLKFAIFKQEVTRLVTFTNSLYVVTKNSEQGIRALTTIATLAEALSETMTIIRAIKTPKFIARKTYRIFKTIYYLAGIAAYVFMMSPFMATAATTATYLRLFAANLKVTMDMIRHTHAGFLIMFKMKKIMKTLRMVQIIINKVARMKRLKRAFKKMSLITGFFYMLALTMAVIIIIFPLFLLLPIAMIGIILAVALFWFMMWLLNKVLAQSAKKAFISMLLIMFITLCFVMIALSLLALIMFAEPILMNMLSLIGMVVVIIAFVALVIVLGKKMTKHMSTIGQVFTGMGTIIGIISLMVVLVGMMYVMSMMSQTIVDNSVNLLLAIGIMLSVGLAAVGLGVAGTYISIAVPGLLVFVGLFGLLLVMAIALRRLSEIELDINKITDTLTNIQTATGLVDEYFSTEFSFSDMFNQISGAGQLSRISGMVSTIEDIAEKLNRLQEIKLDSVAIDTAITNVYDVVKKIEEKINENDKLPDDFTVTDLWKSFKGDIAERLQGSAEKGKLKRADAILGKLVKLAKTIDEIQKVEIDAEKVKTKIDDLYSIVDVIEEKINKNDKLPDDFSAKDVFSSWKKGIAENLQGKAEEKKLKRADAILSRLHNMAEAIDAIQKVEIDEPKTLEKIEMLYRFVDKIQEKIQLEEKLPEDFSIGDWWSSKKKDWAKEKQEDAAQGKIDRTEAILVKLSGICEAINTIQEFELDSVAAEAKVTSILAATKTIYDLVMEGTNLPSAELTLLKGSWSDDDEDAFKALKEKNGRMQEFTDDYVGQIEWICSTVQGLSKKLKTLSELEFKQDEAVNKVKMGFSAVDALINVVSETKYDKLQPDEFNKKHIKMLNVITDINLAMVKLVKMSDKDVNNNKTILEDYGKFIQKVNTMDVNKVQKTAQMFSQMSRFSESVNGNFDKLAFAINEKLMPAVDALKQVLEDIPQLLTKNSQNITKAINDTKNTKPKTEEELREKYKAEGLYGNALEEKVAEEKKEQSKKIERDIPTVLHDIKTLLYGEEKATNRGLLVKCVTT